MHRRISVWKLFVLLALVSLLPGCNVILGLLGGDSGDDPILTLNPNNLEIILDIGETWTITVYALDKQSNVETFSAMSDNTSIVTATKSGTIVTISAVAEGQATVTITSASGKSKMLSVTVNEGELPSEASLVLSSTNETVTIGGHAYVTVTALTASGVTDTFSTASDNTTIATVDKLANQVVITGISEGSTTITVLTGSGLSESISLTVIESVQEETPPPPPVGLITSGATETTMIIQWQPSQTALGYRLYSTTSTTGMADDFIMIYEGPDRECNASGLLPGTQYFFYVIAFNDTGDSEPSTTVSRFTLEEDEPTFTVSGLLDFTFDSDAKQSGVITVSIYTEIDTSLPVPTSLVAATGPVQYLGVDDTVPFTLAGIPAGEYYLFALVDTNSDGLFTEGEPTGISIPAVVVSADRDTIVLEMAAPDRATVTIGVQ